MGTLMRTPTGVSTGAPVGTTTSRTETASAPSSKPRGATRAAATAAAAVTTLESVSAAAPSTARRLVTGGRCHTPSRKGPSWGPFVCPPHWHQNVRCKISVPVDAASGKPGKFCPKSQIGRPQSSTTARSGSVELTGSSLLSTPWHRAFFIAKAHVTDGVLRGGGPQR